MNSTHLSQPPVVLTIAGSDSSGGAGIQADIKTISALGGYAASVITAVTSQNTLGVQELFPLPSHVVRSQLASVMDDLHPSAIKIGMIHHLSQVEAIAEALHTHHPPFVVYDPVMISTSGRRLMTEETVAGIEQLLFPLCTLITPNLDEASLLVGHSITTADDMASSGRQLAHRYGCHVLVKGGHLSGHSMIDLLCTSDNVHYLSEQKIDTHNLHGTGCTLSSAIATCLAQGNSLEEAVRTAKRYTYQAILRAANFHFGQGNGPLWHF